jgi:hypothetical protein
MSGDAELDAMIARIRKLPQLGRMAAPEVARAVEAEAERTIAAGTTPDGTPWAPKKSGEGQPLANAAKALGVVALGSTIFMKLNGPEARHHLGRVKGGTARQIIPTKDIPPPMAAAIREVLTRKFVEVMSND